MNGPPLTDGEPNVGGLRVRPGATISLFVLLGISAAVALWSQGNPGKTPVWLERGAPWIFLVFVVGFAAYRFALVAANRYSAFKAFFQIFVAAIFFMLLLPGSPLVARPKGSSLDRLLTDPDARKMQGAHGHWLGYDVPLAVDAQHDRIVAEDVVPVANDCGQLAALAVAASAVDVEAA